MRWLAAGRQILGLPHRDDAEESSGSPPESDLEPAATGLDPLSRRENRLAVCRRSHASIDLDNYFGLLPMKVPLAVIV